MSFTVLIIFLTGVIVGVVYASSTRKEKPSKEVAETETTTPTYERQLSDAQTLNREIANFRRAYREIMRNKQRSEEERRQFLSEWDKFALEEVLRAKTIGQLMGAKKLVMSGSLAWKIIPHRHEEISRHAVEIAYDVEELMRATHKAPKGGQAEQIGYEKLARLVPAK